MGISITGIPSMVKQEIARGNASYSYSGTTTDSFAQVFTKETKSYENVHILIKNSGASNSLQYQVIAQLDDSGEDYTVLSATTLGAGDTDTVLLEKPYYSVELWVKSATVGNSTSYTVNLIMRS